MIHCKANTQEDISISELTHLMNDTFTCCMRNYEILLPYFEKNEATPRIFHKLNQVNILINSLNEMLVGLRVEYASISLHKLKPEKDSCLVTKNRKPFNTSDKEELGTVTTKTEVKSNTTLEISSPVSTTQKNCKQQTATVKDENRASVHESEAYSIKLIKTEGHSADAVDSPVATELESETHSSDIHLCNNVKHPSLTAATNDMNMKIQYITVGGKKRKLNVYKPDENMETKTKFSDETQCQKLLSHTECVNADQCENYMRNFKITVHFGNNKENNFSAKRAVSEVANGNNFIVRKRLQSHEKIKVRKQIQNFANHSGARLLNKDNFDSEKVLKTSEVNTISTAPEKNFFSSTESSAVVATPSSSICSEKDHRDSKKSKPLSYKTAHGSKYFSKKISDILDSDNYINIINGSAKCMLCNVSLPGLHCVSPHVKGKKHCRNLINLGSIHAKAATTVDTHTDRSKVVSSSQSGSI